VFDWALADAVPPGVRLLLAGGLHHGNVAEAIRRVRPWGVDVATGVETIPGSGHKDPRKLRSFIAAAKEAGEALSGDPWVPDPKAAPYDWMDDGV
jgi:phosphoribosylanthranilate isomerase